MSGPAPSIAAEESPLTIEGFGFRVRDLRRRDKLNIKIVNTQHVGFHTDSEFRVCRLVCKDFVGAETSKDVDPRDDEHIY